MDAEIIHISPGVPLDLLCNAAAGGKGVSRSSITKLFFEIGLTPVVGITGSSGSTTMTGQLGETV